MLTKSEVLLSLDRTNFKIRLEIYENKEIKSIWKNVVNKSLAFTLTRIWKRFRNIFCRVNNSRRKTWVGLYSRNRKTAISFISHMIYFLWHCFPCLLFSFRYIYNILLALFSYYINKIGTILTLCCSDTTFFRYFFGCLNSFWNWKD